MSEIKDKIYKLYWHSNEIDDAVGNYCNQIQSLMNILKDKELVDRWFENLNKLLLEKISIEDFIKLKHIETNNLNKLIKSAIEKHGKLSQEAKNEIIKEFKITIKNYNNEA